MGSQKVKHSERLALLATSQANEWEDYSSSFGEAVGISRNWVTAPFLVFDG